jgi:hypothetical protein
LPINKRVQLGKLCQGDGGLADFLADIERRKYMQSKLTERGSFSSSWVTRESQLD